jgi:hypothetical protein
MYHVAHHARAAAMRVVVALLEVLIGCQMLASPGMIGGFFAKFLYLSRRSNKYTNAIKHALAVRPSRMSTSDMSRVFIICW